MTAQTDPAKSAPESEAQHPAPAPHMVEWLTGTTTVTLPRWALVLGAVVAIALVFVALD